MHSEYNTIARKALTQNPQMVIGQLSPENFDHVAGIAASVMMTRDNFLRGGSFVQSIVDNDLEQAVNRADDVCIRAIKFFVYVKNYKHLNQN
jgi:hypothetical protein